MLHHVLQSKPFGRCTTIKPPAKIETPPRVIYRTSDEDHERTPLRDQRDSLLLLSR